jgi:tetratricopeptide (TPR) repeat protein
MAVALIGAYSNAIHVPFLFDDVPAIVENRSVHALATALSPPQASGVTVSGRPVLNLSLAVNYVIGGTDTRGYHVANVAIHFAAACLLFCVVGRLARMDPTSGTTAARRRLFAFLCAALWALHPLQTESVTYVVQRAESLVGLFYLATIHGFLRWAESPRSWSWAAVAVVACFLGMGTKEVMVSAPLFVVLLDRTMVAGSLAAAWRSRKWFHLALASSWLLLAWCVASSAGRGGTVGSVAEVNAWHYVLTQCYAIFHYLRLVVWPTPLIFDYGIVLVQDWNDVWWRGALLIVGLGAAVWATARRSILGLAGLFFFAVLAPTSSFIPVNTQTMNEHRMYLALAPLLIIAAGGVRRLLPGAWPAVLGALCLAAAVGTWIRNMDYRSAESIWADTIAKQPQNARGWICYAVSLTEREDFVGAERALQRVQEIAPNDQSAWGSLGQLHVKAGSPDKAIAAYERALSLAPEDYDANFDLGIVHLEAGRTEQAIQRLAVAARVRPEAPAAHFNLGNAFVAAGRLSEAISSFERAKELDTGAVRTINNLANAQFQAGAVEQALKSFDSALARFPDASELRISRGAALLSLGRDGDAAADFHEALEREPGNGRAHANLALVLARKGDREGAVESFRRAIENERGSAAPRCWAISPVWPIFWCSERPPKLLKCARRRQSRRR